MKKFNVGIYERLSDEDRYKLNKDDDSESIKNQRRLLIDEINKHPDFILKDEYCDEDLSGAGTYRPEFERLIKDCESGKIDVVLCKSQSRFSRDMEIIEKYIHNKFDEWGVRFISLADNADTNNKGNKKARQINGLVNEWYLEDVSNNIRSAFKIKMKNGEFISPFAAFGYVISPTNNNKLIIDNVASIVVKEIFKLYLNGLGFGAIAKHLNSKNIPSPSLYKYQTGSKLNIVSNKPRQDIKWNSSAIKTILTNELYLGHLIQGKRTTISYKNHKIKFKEKSDWIKVLNTHDPIIDIETFNKVQEIIKRKSRPLKKTGFIHIFSKKVFCLECGCYMRKKNSSKHEYLACSKHQNECDKCSNSLSVRYDLLSNLVLKAINKMINFFYDESELNNIINKQYKKKYENVFNSLMFKKSSIEKEKLKIDNYLKNLYEDKVNKIITIEQFENLISYYNKNRVTYNNEIKIIDKKIYELEKIKHPNLFIKKPTLNELNKIIVDEFIDKIYIGKTNSKLGTRDIKIKWNF